MVVLIICFSIGVGVFAGFDLRERLRAHDDNPFTKIGQITTANGLSVEFFHLKHTRANCVVAVQMVPMEPGRAAIQMECE